jgi:hypothetical protein
MTGLPEGIAEKRRDLSVCVRMFSERITHKRYRRRLIEVRGTVTLHTHDPSTDVGLHARVHACVHACAGRHP